MVKSCKNCRTAKKADFVPCASCDPSKIVNTKSVTTCSKCRTRKKEDFKQCKKCFLKDQTPVVEDIACYMGCDLDEDNKLYKNVNAKGVAIILCGGCIFKLSNTVPHDYQVNLEIKDASMFAEREEE